MLDEVMVSVPTAAEVLHETDAVLDQPPGEQTLRSKRRRGLVVEALHFASRFGLALQVDDADSQSFRSRRLAARQ